MVLLSFAVALLVSFLLFAALSRTRRLSPEFSALAAAIVSAPILVALYATFATTVVAFTEPDRPLSPALAAAGLIAALVLFAPTVLVQAPLIAVYLVRAFRQRPLLSARLVGAIGVGAIALQLVWLETFARAVD